MTAIRLSRPVVATILSAGLLALSAPALAQAWTDGWTFRISVTAKAASIDGNGDLQEFPMLISLDGANHAHVFAGAKADGTDLLVTKADGTTVLAREVVSFDPIGEEAEIWVRADVLSKTTNEFYLYYGNALANPTDPPSAAWNSNYRAVYHFNDDPGAGTLTDSSPNGAHASLVAARMWTSGDVTDAPIHQGWAFNGSTHHIRSTEISTQSGNYSVEAWLFHTTRGTDFFTQTSPGFWHVSSQNQSGMGADFADGNVATGWDPRPIPLDTWHHFAWIFDADADTILFYYNGESQNLRGTFPPDTFPVYTGEPMNPQENNPVGIVGPMFFIEADLHDGAADEFRVHEGILPPEWMLTQYRNQVDPIDFFDFGSEETNVPTPKSSFGQFKSRFGG